MAESSSGSVRSCKLCRVNFKSRKGRTNLLKNPNVIEDLKQIGVEFESISTEDSIHQKCERHIKLIREKDNLRESWVKGNGVKKRKRNEYDPIPAVSSV